jgi:hypothetical protein
MYSELPQRFRCPITEKHDKIADAKTILVMKGLIVRKVFTKKILPKIGRRRWNTYQVSEQASLQLL